MYILAETMGFGGMTLEYYGGKLYTVQHEYYPWICSKEEAKVYSTEAKAKSACDKLNYKVGRNFEVVKI